MPGRAYPSAAALITQDKEEYDEKGEDPWPKWRIRFFYRITDTAVDTLLYIGSEYIVAYLATFGGDFVFRHAVNPSPIPPWQRIGGRYRPSPGNARKNKEFGSLQQAYHVDGIATIRRAIKSRSSITQQSLQSTKFQKSQPNGEAVAPG